MRGRLRRPGVSRGPRARAVPATTDALSARLHPDARKPPVRCIDLHQRNTRSMRQPASELSRRSRSLTMHQTRHEKCAGEAGGKARAEGRRRGGSATQQCCGSRVPSRSTLMGGRSTSTSKADDLALPARVKIAVHGAPWVAMTHAGGSNCSRSDLSSMISAGSATSRCATAIATAAVRICVATARRGHAVAAILGGYRWLRNLARSERSRRR